MKLVLDLGNTASKIAVFKGEDMIFNKTVQASDNLLSYLKELEFNASILCSVVNHADELENYLKKCGFYCKFNSDTKIPIKNDYQTPNTLGLDRLAAAIGALRIVEGNSVLNIDAGTCLKYNLVLDNCFCGGAISPGLEMRNKVMHDKTAKLPLVQILDYKSDSIIGLNTNDSLISGLVNGVIFEIDGFINDLKNKYPELPVVLSGGDAAFLEKRLKNSIFADSNLVLKGLHAILQYNQEI